MPDIEWNRETWDKNHTWDLHGDEWTGMAEHCGQPYQLWKESLIEEFLLPHLHPDTHALEVAPGHGRFTETIVPRVRDTVLVDISPACLTHCRDRFGDTDLSYVLTDGVSLPGIPDASIDFIWSFDSFVHMELEVIAAYLGEFRRVLVTGGEFTVHHAGKNTLGLRMKPLTSRLGTPGRVAHRLMSQGRLRDSGRRADVSKDDVARLAHQRGLRIRSQRQAWGDHEQYDVAKYGDWLTCGVCLD